jgi:hypothetical protein
MAQTLYLYWLSKPPPFYTNCGNILNIASNLPKYKVKRQNFYTNYTEFVWTFLSTLLLKMKINATSLNNKLTYLPVLFFRLSGTGTGRITSYIIRAFCAKFSRGDVEASAKINDDEDALHHQKML